MPKTKIHVRIWVHVHYWSSGEAHVYINRLRFQKGKELKRSMVNRTYPYGSRRLIGCLVKAIEDSLGKKTYVIRESGWSVQIDR